MGDPPTTNDRTGYAAQPPSARRSGPVHPTTSSLCTDPGRSTSTTRAASLARRARATGSYLSSIGTRPGWRGRGYGSLVTALAVVEAIEAGSDLIHLAVDVDNDGARRLYERLGFAVVGDPVPDLLLR